MTENEYTIDELIDFMYNVMDDSDEEAIPFVKEVIQALEEIQQYRATGTIEEFKALKEKNMAEEVKENNKQLVCEIKIDAEMMRKIIDEKMTQIELDIQEIRAKAIDEFAERLKEEYVFDSICRDDINKYEYKNKIDRIAEQLKEGI